MTLSNGSRTLSALGVANLEVDLQRRWGRSGTCSADQYYGPGLTSAPTSTRAGFPAAVVGGAWGTGTICPSTGNAAGLPADTIAQTDELSGGQTSTEVADVADTSPLAGETVYGSFTALADATSGVPPDRAHDHRGRRRRVPEREH